MADSNFIPDSEFIPDQGTPAPGVQQANFVPDNEFLSDEDKYSTLGQVIKTGLEHAAGSATMGLSTKAEVALGVNPKDIKGRTEANPGSSIVGDIAGIGGSLLIPGFGEANATKGAVEGLNAAKTTLEAAQAAHAAEGSVETANAVINAKKAFLSAQEGLNTAKNTFRAGDLLNPVQATSKLGRNVAEGAKDFLGVSSEVGSGASKVLNYAKSIGATALGSAVEGAIYNGLGGSLTEDALGDNKNLNGEQLFSHIMGNFGTGWLTGGLLGGGLHLGAALVPESIGAIRDGITGVRNVVLGTGDADAGLVGAILPEGDGSFGKFRQALENRTINLSPEDKDAVAKELSSQLQRVDNNIKTATGDVYDSINSDASKAKINELPQMPMIDMIQKHTNLLSDAAKEMRQDPELWSQGAAKVLENQANKLTDLATRPGDISNSEIVDALRDTKKVIQRVPYQSDINGSSSKLKELAGEINSDIKNPAVVGDVASRLASADDIYSTGKDFFNLKTGDPEELIKRKDFVSSFFTKQGKNGYIWDPTKMSKLLGATDSIKKQNALEMLEKYHEYQKMMPDHLEEFAQNVPNNHMPASDLRDMIDKSQMKTSEAFEKYSSEAKKANKSGLLEGLAAMGIATGHPLIGLASEAMDFGLNPLSKVQKLASIEQKISEVTNHIGKGVKAVFSTATKAAKPFVGLATRLTDQQMNDHEDDAQKYLSMSTDLQQITNHLTENTKDIYDVAPGTTLAVQQAASRATQFLASKLPPQPSQNALDPKYQPSTNEMAKFMHYKAVVEKPMIALQEIKDGTITPDTVETLRAVYPQLYSQMQVMLSTEAQTRAKEGSPLPYSRRLALSTFLGSPVDSNFSSQSVMSNQAIYAAPAQNQQPGPGQAKASKTGMGKMKLSSRFSRQPNDDA